MIYKATVNNRDVTVKCFKFKSEVDRQAYNNELWLLDKFANDEQIVN